jgi:hypothetical protein
MSHSYLEITYRQGKPLAAYLYLPRQPGDVSANVQERQAGYIIDLAADGRPIGIEMPSPSLVTLEAVNQILNELNHAPLEPAELAPLVAA